jgi:threonine synthase
MREVFSSNKYVMDPHGAVAYLGLKEFLKSSNINTLDFFGNGASGKIQGCSRRNVADFRSNSRRPAESFYKHPKKSIPLSKDYQAFKDFLKANF